MKQFLKGLFMARPTTIKSPDGGEIILKNCTKETIESIRNFLLMKNELPEEVIEEPIKSTVAPIPTSTNEEAPLHCGALGVYQNPLTLNWHVCELKFSPYSKKGKVEKDYPVDKDKATCDERFKIAAVNMNLVG